MDDEVPIIPGTGETFMEATAIPAAAARRDEDIALDLMKFIAATTGYGKSGAAGGVGFEKSGAASKPEEYAAHLLELYRRCLTVVSGRK